MVCLCPRQRTFRLSCGTPLTDEDERRPEGWMRLVILSAVDHGQHRAPQRLGASYLRVALQFIDRLGDQLDGGLRRNLPVRDEQRAVAGVEESARQARESLRALRCTCGRIAGGHPVGVE